MDVVVVPAEDSPHFRQVGSDWDSLCQVVDDYSMDVVVSMDGRVAMLVAGNGKQYSSHTPNPTATMLMERVLPGFAKTDRVEGAAVFVGVGEDGDFGSTPGWFVELVENRLGSFLSGCS